MAPVLGAVLGQGVAGSGVTGTSALADGQLAVVGTLTALSAFLLLSLLLLLCAGCQGQKKTKGHPGDHENLMNGVSEKDTCSQSADSHGTDLVASSSHNGPLTSGTVLTDTIDTSPHPSEEMLSSQSELRSSKCPQDRELPSIPPNSALEAAVATADTQAASGEGTYEVVKETASRDVSVEDSLYETVKELKDPGLPNGTLSPDPPPQATALLNGHLTPSPGPATPERNSLPSGAEYASVDLNKKSRYSTDMEGRRSAVIAAKEEEPEEENPPPIPDKVLDENDNQQLNHQHNGLHNGELHSPLSPTTGPTSENNAPLNCEITAMYSTVVKPELEEKENDYSSIGEIKGLVPESNSSDLYATVKEVYPSSSNSQPQEERVENVDPGYETIKIPKTGEERQQGNGQFEPDYESVAELGLNREVSRL
ncbi:phosphoprotein associated with glycosphingolipid-enriched microdomains 1 [Chanos chanos]|uniref:Phosphoprotein associated with glycosphingolipid-enriched microdomains 1 n=1 Tax=Chanos chanos TaxID=29144 RepID=A0A6J2WII9_CHACN|nr:phosphoprotein associated with glycosphingolipid-enriched microdomains 1 [Chanos chanos]